MTNAETGNDVCVWEKETCDDGSIGYESSCGCYHAASVPETLRGICFSFCGFCGKPIEIKESGE